MTRKTESYTPAPKTPPKRRTAKPKRTAKATHTDGPEIDADDGVIVTASYFPDGRDGET
jgi:hypothetical protein